MHKQKMQELEDTFNNKLENSENIFQKVCIYNSNYRTWK